MAGRDTGVVCRTARAGFGPLVVEAFEHVAVAHFLRGSEAEAGVIELEVVMAGGDFESIAIQGLVDVVNGESNEGDGRRDGVNGKVSGVDFDEAFRCGEPEEAVVGTPG